MDPDNQIPGGLFNSLQISRPQQHAVMSHFTAYESGRNYIEAASVEKHFERATFGFTGIKPIYNQTTPTYVLMRLWPNITAVMLWALGGVIWSMTLCSKKQLLKKEQ
jgi:ABC-2 type transport system permease protein